MIEYTASALVDQAFHSATMVPVEGNEGVSVVTDVDAFEQQELERLGMPDGIVMRHRPTHFQRE